MVNVIKKATVPANLLTELDWEANGYILRYRIKSENKNLTSHWSPIYILTIDSFPLVGGSFFESQGEDGQTNITVIWDDLVERPLYDIFVAFRGVNLSESFEYDEDQFFYHGTSSNHNYSFLKKENTSSLRIIVQPAANKKLIKSNFIIYDSDLQS